MLRIESLEHRRLLAGVDLFAAADAYVRSGADSGQNFGSADEMDVKQAGNPSYSRTGYVRFDLSSVNDLTSATLRLLGSSNATGGQSVPVKVIATAGDWSETQITANNQPGESGAPLGTINVVSNTKWYEIDVTAAVQSALLQSQTTISFKLAGAGQTSPFARFASRESGDAPQLRIETDGTPPPVEPPPVEPPPTESAGDAYVRAGSDASKNFGDEGALQVKHSTSSAYVRQAFVKFDLAGISTGTFSSATLRLFGKTNFGTVGVKVALADNNWSEDAITFNTAPDVSGASLGTINVTSSAQWLELDVTAALEQAIASGKTSISFALVGAAPTSAFASFNSSEASTGRPELSISDNPPAPTPAQPISWQTKASAVQKREESITFVANDKLYVIGGYIDGAFRAGSRVDRYDPKTDTWQRMNDAPLEFTHSVSAMDPQTGLIWVMGGYIGDFPHPPATDAVWIYNPTTDTWTPGPSLPADRGAGGGGIVGRRIHHFGGANSERSDSYVDHWSLDLDDPNAGWRREPDFPVAFNHVGYATVNGKLYAVGGQTGLEGAAIYTGATYVFDPATGQWSLKASMPEPLSHFTEATGVYKNRYILTAGGEKPHDTAQDDVFLYDTVEDKWTVLTSLPDGRRTPGGDVIGDLFIVNGGYKRSLGMTRNTWVADLSVLNLPA